ncbi:MAG: DNA gyrase inhibitor YacG [Gammaproteobacteria bacterium]|nr:DNA gyrase inhibitor YacG [Gammaproteobacteria bacterium]
MTVECPTCRKSVQWLSSNEFRPFCSDRCRLIDLGEWAQEKRSIPSDRHYGNIDPEQE